MVEVEKVDLTNLEMDDKLYKSWILLGILAESTDTVIGYTL